MTHVLFIHSAGPQGPGEGSTALVAGLAAALPAQLPLIAPLMPHPEAPEAEPWIAACQRAIDGIEDALILVGHSLGGSMLMSTIVRHGVPERVRGLVLFGAPFWSAPGWEFADFVLPPDAAARLRDLRRLVILHGEKDDVVAADHPARYQKLVPTAQIHMLAGVGHGGGEAGPLLCDVVKTLA